MAEPVYTWDYFDDGHRPPTVFELAQDIAEAMKEADVISVTHRLDGFGNRTEEIIMHLAMSGGTSHEAAENVTHDVIGMQGPAKVAFRATAVEMNTGGHHQRDGTFEGQVYYG